MEQAEIAARLAIADLLALYCRAIDRCDADLLARVFTADALIDYGDGAKPVAETIPVLMAGLGTMRLTQHNISNTILRLDGDRARAETHCAALHILPGPEGEVELTVGGRYLDRLVQRAGEWRIAERLYVMDWNRTVPSTMRLDGPLLGTLRRHGQRAPDDPSVRWWEVDWSSSSPGG